MIQSIIREWHDGSLGTAFEGVSAAEKARENVYKRLLTLADTMLRYRIECKEHWATLRTVSNDRLATLFDERKMLLRLNCWRASNRPGDPFISPTDFSSWNQVEVTPDLTEQVVFPDDDERLNEALEMMNESYMSWSRSAAKSGTLQASDGAGNVQISGRRVDSSRESHFG